MRLELAPLSASMLGEGPFFIFRWKAARFDHRHDIHDDSCEQLISTKANHCVSYCHERWNFNVRDNAHTRLRSVMPCPNIAECRRFKSCQPDENRWKQRRFRRFENPVSGFRYKTVQIWQRRKNLVTFFAMPAWFRPSGFSNGNGMDGVQLSSPKQDTRAAWRD